jgi:hypothetical protein
MVLQCVAAGACLFYLSYDPPQVRNAANWCWWVTVVSIWSALILTVYSGVVYIRAAVQLLRE